MSGSVNLAIMQGNLGRDPDIRTMNNGDRLANFSIATSERWTDKRSGEKMEKTEWIRVSVFNQSLVNVIDRYVKKGSQVYIEGELRTREWTDKQGEKRHTTEVVLTQIRGVLKLMGSPKGGGDNAPARAPSGTDQRGNPRYDDDNSEIPF